MIDQALTLRQFHRTFSHRKGGQPQCRRRLRPVHPLRFGWPSVIVVSVAQRTVFGRLDGSGRYHSARKSRRVVGVEWPQILYADMAGVSPGIGALIGRRYDNPACSACRIDGRLIVGYPVSPAMYIRFRVLTGGGTFCAVETGSGTTSW